MQEYRFILDVIPPTIKGGEACRQMRRHSDVPIIVMTWEGNEKDFVDSLRDGADDYLFKPFDFEMLAAKVESLLRRAGLPPALNPIQFYCDAYLAINLTTREVFVQGQPVHLRPKEYELLAYLARHAGQIVLHEQILQAIWGWEETNYIRNIHLNIGRLRQKIETNPQHRYIVTVPKVGYRFKKWIAP